MASLRARKADLKRKCEFSAHLKGFVAHAVHGKAAKGANAKAKIKGTVGPVGKGTHSGKIAARSNGHHISAAQPKARPAHSRQGVAAYIYV